MVLNYYYQKNFYFLNKSLCPDKAFVFKVIVESFKSLLAIKATVIAIYYFWTISFQILESLFNGLIVINLFIKEEGLNDKYFKSSNLRIKKVLTSAEAGSPHVGVSKDYPNCYIRRR
jgi:hypothetical protein